MLKANKTHKKERLREIYRYIYIPAVTNRRLYCMRLWARPRGFFFLSCFATLGVWPLTLPARARDPCTLPEKTKTPKHINQILEKNPYRIWERSEEEKLFGEKWWDYPWCIGWELCLFSLCVCLERESLKMRYLGLGFYGQYIIFYI